MLRTSLSACRIIHLLRGSDLTGNQDALQDYNDIVLEALSTLLNLTLTPQARKQALLPIARAGLDLRDALALAVPAILSSMHQNAELICSIVSEEAWAHFLASRESIMT